MKNLFLISILFVLSSFAQPTAVTEVNAGGGTVYICTGPQSKRYHCDRYCQGLNSCSKRVIAVSISKARSMGRTPCKWCY